MPAENYAEGQILETKKAPKVLNDEPQARSALSAEGSGVREGRRSPFLILSLGLCPNKDFKHER